MYLNAQRPLFVWQKAGKKKGRRAAESPVFVWVWVWKRKPQTKERNTRLCNAITKTE